jgi:hypothetical protein
MLLTTNNNTLEAIISFSLESSNSLPHRLLTTSFRIITARVQSAKIKDEKMLARRWLHPRGILSRSDTIRTHHGPTMIFLPAKSQCRRFFRSSPSPASRRSDAADAWYTSISITMIISNGGASTPKRGAFILLEGVDRCGKTTQVSLLVKHLLSLSIATVALRFPDRTTQGEFNANAAMLSFDHHVLGNGMHIFLHEPNNLLMFTEQYPISPSPVS